MAVEAADPRSTKLTGAQRLLWLGQRLHRDAPLYNMALAFEIRGAVDPAHFEHAFRAVTARSDAFRAAIVVHNDEPHVIDTGVIDQPVEHIDMSGTTDVDAALADWLRKRAARPFDLTRRLFDCVLIRLESERWVWFLNQHHLVTDGWSAALTYRLVAEYYERSVIGTLEQAPALPRFSDYAAYESAFRDSPVFARVRSYWQEKLSRPIAPVRMYGHDRDVGGTRTDRLTRDLGDERSGAVRALAERYSRGMFGGHVLTFGIFATVLFAWLHRVSGQSRLAIGTPSHNRPTRDFKETPGVFIEVFPFLVDVDADATFESLLDVVRGETAAFLRHAQPGTSSAAVNRSYNVLLNYIHASFPSFAGMPMRSEWVHAGHGDAAHHLRLQVHDFDATGRFVIHFDFHCDVFAPEQREAAADQLISVLDAFLARPSSPIADAPLLTPAQASAWLDRVTPEPSTFVRETVIERFDAAAKRAPHRIAITDNDDSVTYGALSARARSLATRLARPDVDAGPHVGILANRGIDAIVAILGVLYAGRAYVPLTPADPDRRLLSIIRDAGIRVILTDGSQDAASARLSAEGDDVTVLSIGAASREHDPPLDWTAPAATDAAYVLFTSGSTGQPKGVVIEHGSLANYVQWALQQYAADGPADFPLFTSLAFDLTVTSLFVPLVAGGRIRIYRDGDPVPAVIRVLEDGLVDVVKLTPSHLSLLRNRSFPPGRVRTLIVGGEELRRDQADDALRAIGSASTLYNEYGPTEATVGCMIHRYAPGTDMAASVPIGRAAANARILVLDRALNVLPPGVPGEIAIGGPNLARGYLGRPDLTAERFVADPLRVTERLYRTGDIGRWRSDGVLEYLGRSDDQIKIRGVRVEPGEVEAALRTFPGIHAAAVIATGARRERIREAEPCARCGLPASYPGADLDDDGVCNLCRRFDGYRSGVSHYFRTMPELERELAAARESAAGEHDCLLLLSGGKDSTYALARLVDLGARVFAFTLDNGYISEGAKANITRVTRQLGVPHVFATTPAMNAIFVDSLKRHSNVCNGCFKTVYTLGARFARKNGIPLVVTGLSRGQFFETRLTEELFLDDDFDSTRIDQVVLEARKAYHRADDAVARLLDTGDFHDDAMFEDVRFLDFYRYCDVELDEMLAYLSGRVPWIRPADTGRSTNCLINQAGIYVHIQERGYHNYAFPYSWDVRLGHKQRDAALAELDDDIDPDEVRRILGEIGYDLPALPQDLNLVACYVADEAFSTATLREHLARLLPAAMVPARFLRLDALPLGPSGKVDRLALADAEPARPAALATAFVAPQSEVETRIATIWQDVLRIERIGTRDAFLDLGGNSLLAIQVISRVNHAFDVDLPLRSAFEASTIESLARLVERTLLEEIEALTDAEAERLAVSDR